MLKMCHLHMMFISYLTQQQVSISVILLLFLFHFIL